jgi:hypothetical protein
MFRPSVGWQSLRHARWKCRDYFNFLDWWTLIEMWFRYFRLLHILWLTDYMLIIWAVASPRTMIRQYAIYYTIFDFAS